MTTALVIFIGMLMLSFLVVVVVPFGAATDEKSRSQRAADAAALAGAQEIRTQWVDLSTAVGVLVFPLLPTPPVAPFSGSGSATSYASVNQGQVVRYDVTPGQGRVFARVRNTDPAYPATGTAESESTVEMDISFNGCRWDNPIPPSPPGSGGPPFFDRTLICGEWRASYRIVNSPGSYRTVSYAGGDSRTGLYEDLEPRIIE